MNGRYLNITGAPNLAYEINFGNEQDDKCKHRRGEEEMEEGLMLEDFEAEGRKGKKKIKAKKSSTVSVQSQQATDVTMESHEMREVEVVLQKGEENPKVKKDRKEKHMFKNSKQKESSKPKLEPSTDLFLY